MKKLLITLLIVFSAPSQNWNVKLDTFYVDKKLLGKNYKSSTHKVCGVEGCSYVHDDNILFNGKLMLRFICISNKETIYKKYKKEYDYLYYLFLYDTLQKKILLDTILMYKFEDFYRLVLAPFCVIEGNKYIFIPGYKYLLVYDKNSGKLYTQCFDPKYRWIGSYGSQIIGKNDVFYSLQYFGAIHKFLKFYLKGYNRNYKPLVKSKIEIKNNCFQLVNTKSFGHIRYFQNKKDIKPTSKFWGTLLVDTFQTPEVIYLKYKYSDTLYTYSSDGNLISSYKVPKSMYRIFADNSYLYGMVRKKDSLMLYIYDKQNISSGPLNKIFLVNSSFTTFKDFIGLSISDKIILYYTNIDNIYYEKIPIYRIIITNKYNF